MTKIFFIMKLFTILSLYYFHPLLAREEWIDPHDMGIDVGARHYRQKDNHDQHCDNRDNQEGHQLRQILGLIVDTVYYKKNTEQYEGRLNVQLNKEDYKFLVNVQSGHKDYSTRKFIEMLRNSIHINDGPLLSIWENIHEYLLLHTEYVLLSISLMALLAFLWRLQPHNYSYSTLFKLFLPLVYISDFVLRYRGLLEEVEIDHYITQSDYEKCDRSKMGWWAWIWDEFTGDCKRNDREMLLSQRAAIHIITPMKVISQQFDVIVPILQHIGTGFGQFAWALMSNVPWYVVPLMAIPACVLTFVLLLMFGASTLGISPKLHITPFFKLEFLLKGHIQDNKERENDSISGENLKLLLASKTSNSNPIHITNGPGIKKKNTTKGHKKKTGETWRKAITHRAKENERNVTIREESEEGWPNWGGGDQENKKKEKISTPSSSRNQENSTKTINLIEFD